MKPIAPYVLATIHPNHDVLDDDLAAWLQAREQAVPSPSPRTRGSRLGSAIRRRLPFRRTSIRIARRPA